MPTFTLRDYLAFFFSASAIVAVVAQVIGFESTFVQWPGTMLICAFSGVIISGLYLMSPDSRPVTTTIALACLIFVQLRLVAFAVLPSEAVGFLQIAPFTHAEVTRTLAWVVIGTAALFLGIEAAASITLGRVEKPNNRPRPTFPPAGMVLLWALAATVNVAVIGFVQDGELPSAVGWIARFFEVDVALLITVVWVTIYPPQKRSILLLAWGLIAFGLMLSIFGGSRGGAIRIASLILMAVSLLPHAKFSIPRAACFIALIGLLSVGSAMGGHLMRLANVTGESIVGGAMDAMVHDISRQDIYAKTGASVAIQPNSFRALAVSLTNSLNPVLIRIGNFDYTALVLNRPADEAILNTYVRSPYALLRIINGLLPGDLFAGTTLSTAQVINIAYRGYSTEHALENYLSEPWTIWGLAGVMFGTWGGPIFLFAVGAILQAGFKALFRLPTPFRGVVQLTYLFGFVYGAVLMYGIDHTALPMVHYAFATASAFAIIFGSDALYQFVASKVRLNRLRPSTEPGK